MQKLHLHMSLEGPWLVNSPLEGVCQEALGPRGQAFLSQLRRYAELGQTLARGFAPQVRDALKLLALVCIKAGLGTRQLTGSGHKHLKLMPRAEGTSRFLKSLNLPVYLSSVNFCPLAAAAAERLEISRENLFCSPLDLESLELSAAEARELEGLMAELAASPPLSWPQGAKTLEDLPSETRDTVQRLDRFFQEVLPRMPAGQKLSEIKLMAGEERVMALKESLSRSGLSLRDVIYVGSSAADVAVLQEVRAKGGVAVAFNADRFALRAGEILVAADTAWPVALLVAVYLQWGREGVVELAQSTRPGASRYLVLPEAMIEPIARGLEGGTFHLYHPSTSRREEVQALSDTMRRNLAEAVSVKAAGAGA